MKHFKLPAAALLGAGCLALAPQLAFAESTIGLDMGFYTTSEDQVSLTMVAPVVRAMVGVGENFGVGLDWGFVYIGASAGDESDGRFNLGNPFLAGYYRMALSDNLKLQVGGGVALPLANLPDDDINDFGAAVIGYGAAMGSRGMRDLWLYAPETMSLVAPASLEVTGGPLVLGADAAFGVLLPVGDLEGDEVDMVLQLSPRAGLRLGMVTVGARLTEVLLLTGEADDRSQLSVEPFVEADIGSVNLRAAFNFNIDEPAGPSTDDGQLWAFNVGAGARF